MMVSLAAAGQSFCKDPKPSCPNVPKGKDQELKNPPELSAQGSELSTTFDVRMEWICVPTSVDPDGSWKRTPMCLRSYVYPDPKVGALKSGLPGPTLRLRKASDRGPGQDLTVLLPKQPEREPLQSSRVPVSLHYY
jgi:hypothetical protein